MSAAAEHAGADRPRDPVVRLPGLTLGKREASALLALDDKTRTKRDGLDLFRARLVSVLPWREWRRNYWRRETAARPWVDSYEHLVELGLAFNGALTGEGRRIAELLRTRMPDRVTGERWQVLNKLALANVHREIETNDAADVAASILAGEPIAWPLTKADGGRP